MSSRFFIQQPEKYGSVSADSDKFVRCVRIPYNLKQNEVKREQIKRQDDLPCALGTLF